MSRIRKGLIIIKNEGIGSFLKIFANWLVYYSGYFAVLANVCIHFFLHPNDFLKGRKSSFVEYKSIELTSEPEVTIIIPFRDTVDVLKRCVESILRKTTYEKYRIVLVNNQSVEAETNEYLERVEESEKISIMDYNDVFNYSAIHNHVIDKIQTEYILLLNNDTEIINPEWLTEMMKIGQDERIGAVGALLLYPDGTVQHAGMAIINSRSNSFQPYSGRKINGRTNKRVYKDCEYCAVCAACMLTKKSLYVRVGGLDSENMPISWSDVDYCLKLRESGYKIIYSSKAQIMHHESYSRGNDLIDPTKRERYNKEKRYFLGKWKDRYRVDPFYSVIENYF